MQNTVKLEKITKFIYNILSKRGELTAMMNMNNKNTKRYIAAVIAVLLVLAMIVPLVASVL
jgi:glucan phosphoethanolaminetransferase (alkaline phosphatase superfamily)